MTAIDITHDPARQSWVASAQGHPDFPIQNLPFGCFSPPDAAPGDPPRGGVAIGDMILDLHLLHRAGLLAGDAALAAEAASGGSLNRMLVLGEGPRCALRQAVSALLDVGSPPRPALLHAAAACTLHLPADIGDYTDFYAGIHHAMNVGRLLRPDAPLMPNYKYVPVGYHGRASSVRVSGTPVRRPNGQRKPAAEIATTFGP